MFVLDDLDKLPVGAQRYLAAAIAPGTLLFRTAHLVMRGEIELEGPLVGVSGRTGSRAGESIIWTTLRVARVVIGSDQYVSGRGWMSWKVAGLWSVVDVEGPDVSRSGAGRCAGETCWLPTMWLPRFGTTWTEEDRTHLTVRTTHDGHESACRLHLDDDDRIRTLVLDRWGDPDETGVFGLHPFGMDVTATATFSGLTVPSEGRVGWFHGTPRWSEGEFFRFRITALRPAA